MKQFISISKKNIKIGSLKMSVDYWAKRAKEVYGHINDPVELKVKLGTPNFSYLVDGK